MHPFFCKWCAAVGGQYTSTTLHVASLTSRDHKSKKDRLFNTIGCATLFKDFLSAETFALGMSRFLDSDLQRLFGTDRLFSTIASAGVPHGCSARLLSAGLTDGRRAASGTRSWLNQVAAQGVALVAVAASVATAPLALALAVVFRR